MFEVGCFTSRGPNVHFVGQAIRRANVEQSNTGQKIINYSASGTSKLYFVLLGTV